MKDQTGTDEKCKGKKGLRKQINMQQLQLQKYLLRSLDQRGKELSNSIQRKDYS